MRAPNGSYGVRSSPSSDWRFAALRWVASRVQAVVFPQALIMVGITKVNEGSS
jgi:hypothetical protein